MEDMYMGSAYYRQKIKTLNKIEKEKLDDDYEKLETYLEHEELLRNECSKVYGVYCRFTAALLFMHPVWYRLLTVAYFFFRPMIKWLLRMTTGQCEVLRICNQHPEGVIRTKLMEHSLKLSRQHQLNRLTKECDTHIEMAIVQVGKIKYILPEKHPKFEPGFRRCLTQINGYMRLQHSVEEVRKIKYSSENQLHEEKLQKLWTVLSGGLMLESRISSQWTTLGFQGNDPQTDFRGMGQLGLDQLLYFSTKYTDVARSLLMQSHNPTTGYSFAIVGINMTELVYQLLQMGKLKPHFYALEHAVPTLEDYHEVYCYVFHEFDKFWYSEKPRDIMDFGKIREKYRRHLKNRLKRYTTVLIGDFQREDGS